MHLSQCVFSRDAHLQHCDAVVVLHQEHMMPRAMQNFKLLVITQTSIHNLESKMKKSRPVKNMDTNNN